MIDQASTSSVLQHIKDRCAGQYGNGEASLEAACRDVAYLLRLAERLHHYEEIHRISRAVAAIGAFRFDHELVAEQAVLTEQVDLHLAALAQSPGGSIH